MVDSTPLALLPHLRETQTEMKRWLFLNIWCRYLYRPTMRLLHRFNLHYAPPTPMTLHKEERHHWCQWCGLRGDVYKTPNRKEGEAN